MANELVIKTLDLFTNKNKTKNHASNKICTGGYADAGSSTNG